MGTSSSFSTASHRMVIMVVMISVMMMFEGALAKASSTDETQQVPNGQHVFANGHYWPSIFHQTWRGGSTTAVSLENEKSESLNLFGRAFLSAGKTWTTALCQSDSDGDGFTNGEELGDPNCTWSFSSTAATQAATPLPSTSLQHQQRQQLSHPGLWSSVPASRLGEQKLHTTTCTRDVAPPTADSERALQRSSSATEFELPSSWSGVSRSAQYVQEFKPQSDFGDSAIWGPLNYSCPHQWPNLKDWHDQTTWGGVLPAAGASVTIPENTKVLISSCSIPALGFAKITVPASSKLIFGPGPIGLRVKDVIVHGELWIGSADCPNEAPVSITFTGAKSERHSYTNGIVAQGSGKIEIHGTQQDWTWTRIQTSLPSGSQFLVAQDPVGWGLYEEVMITTSIYKDLEQNQNEVRRIAAVHPTNKSLFILDSPLLFDHYGGPEYQCEVALLWRSLLFRGDTSGYEESYGGHIMADAEKTTLKVSGARAERMGQRNVLARYPFHIHLLKEGGVNSYIQQVACVHSYFRCAVVHGTNHSLVRKSVSFNSSGHTFYLEDGAEMYNRIEYNLAAHVHTIGKPAAGGTQRGEVFEQTDEVLQPADHTASGFYIPNPHNYLVGNAASGGWGGFAYPVFATTLKTSLDIHINPSSYPVLRFEGNTAHSSGYYWIDGGCVYFGGKLWQEVETNSSTGVITKKMKYTQGRTSHPTRPAPDGTKQYHNISHLRTWLCNKGYSSWGDFVEIDRYEASDIRRSAVVFGESSIQNALITGTTQNDPLDMRNEDGSRQGFSFYDIWVRTSLFNVEFRNYWRKLKEPSWYRNGVIVDTTFSDIFKPWGISALKQLKFSGVVDQGITLRRWVRESGASRMFNVVDWDGSMINSPDKCAGWIIGSNIDWWNAGDGSCYYNGVWQAWICRRVTGREVVGIDMDLPGLTLPQYSQQLDVQTDQTTNVLSADDRAAVNIGWMTQFGSQGQNRRLRITRNRHLATGLSGMGWYMWSQYGMPQSFRIDAVNMPRGAWILLAIAFPPASTFKIYAQSRWGIKTPLYYRQLESREAVARDNGTAYHFDGKNLYIKVGDMFSPYPNAYSRNGVDIYKTITPIGDLFVEADCGSSLTAPDKEGNIFCQPTAFEAPPELDNPSDLNVTCSNEEVFINPTPFPGECSNKSMIPPPGYKSCYDYTDTWTCRVSDVHCPAVCGPQCRRVVPFPLNCSKPPKCSSASEEEEVPSGSSLSSSLESDITTHPTAPVVSSSSSTYKPDLCTKVMNEHPLSDVCRMATCVPQTGEMVPMNLPEGSPCELPIQGGFGLCTSEAKCVPDPQKINHLIPLANNETSETMTNMVSPISIISARRGSPNTMEVQLAPSFLTHFNVSSVARIEAQCQTLGRNNSHSFSLSPIDAAGLSATPQVYGGSATAPLRFQHTFPPTSRSSASSSSSETIIQDVCARKVMFLRAYDGNGQQISTSEEEEPLLTVFDWRKTINVVPSVRIESVTENKAFVWIDPADWAEDRVFLRFTTPSSAGGSGGGSHRPLIQGRYIRSDTSSTSSLWEFDASSGAAFEGATDAQVELQFANGVSINRTLHCLAFRQPAAHSSSSSYTSSPPTSCLTDTTTVRDELSSCQMDVIREANGLAWQSFRVNNIPSSLTVSAVLVKGLGRESSGGGDAVIPEIQYYGYVGYQGGTRNLIDNTIVEVQLQEKATNKSAGSEFFLLHPSSPMVGWSLPCVNSTESARKYHNHFQQLMGVPGVCDYNNNNTFQCVPSQNENSSSPSSTTSPASAMNSDISSSATSTTGVASSVSFEKADEKIDIEGDSNNVAVGDGNAVSNGEEVQTSSSSQCYICYILIGVGVLLLLLGVLTAFVVLRRRRESRDGRKGKQSSGRFQSTDPLNGMHFSHEEFLRDKDLIIHSSSAAAQTSEITTSTTTPVTSNEGESNALSAPLLVASPAFRKSGQKVRTVSVANISLDSHYLLQQSFVDRDEEGDDHDDNDSEQQQGDTVSVESLELEQQTERSNQLQQGRTVEEVTTDRISNSRLIIEKEDI